MKIEIHELKTKKELKDFVQFQQELYKDNKYYIPQLISDEIELFDRSKNPAFIESEAKIFVAKIDNKIVGRIAAINNVPANKKYKTQNIRFGWFDSIDNQLVADKLFESVENWGRELGMTTITGPHGFCDMDPQGMLIYGFDKLGTIGGIYNYEYYNKLVEQNGFVKDVDYVEFISKPPYVNGMPQKLLEAAEWVKKRNGFKLVDYTNSRQYIARGYEIFELLEESFEEIYGTVPLNKEQINYYIKKYIKYIHKDLIKLVVTEEDLLIGFMITMPSMSKAFQKAKGKYFPFGIYHILKAFRTYEILDFYFAGVKKEYRGKGVDLLMIVEIVKSAMELGFQLAESNQELENNTKVQAEWKYFSPELHKKRRIYKKVIKND